MPIRWLDQVHGTRVVEVDGRGSATKQPGRCAGDGGCASDRSTGIALGVLVADCLPVLLADRAGSVIGVAHAGWRGLAAGVLENTVGLMRPRRPDADLVAWLGPCIGPSAFEVGEDVLELSSARDARAAAHFSPGVRPGKWWADLPGSPRSGWSARRVAVSRAQTPAP